MYQLRLSSLILTSLFGLILSFITITQSTPDSIYHYEHQTWPNSVKDSYVGEIHLLHRKLRIRRDAEGEDNALETKSQNINEVSKASTNSGADLPNISKASSPESANSHKNQIIETHTMGSIGNNTDSLWESVDRPDTVINKTFNSHLDEIPLRKNETWKLQDDDIKHNTTEDHKYYVAQKWAIDENHPYIDLDYMNKTKPNSVKEHPMLSRSYRRAATIPLNFSFPFYGHNVKNITIATGGFLYTGDYVHSWLAATQYIAPLMANFDTSSSPNSKIRYADNGTALIVEWLNVTIQNRNAGMTSNLNGNLPNFGPSHGDDTYRFQVILHKTGDIVFAYKTIPTSIEGLEDTEHPVKVGLSDAYIIDRTIFFVRRKTIYEYHRINKKKNDVTSGTAIWFMAQPTCNLKAKCSECVALKCNWCQKVNRCSDGMDRLRQGWLMARCDEENAKTQNQCKNIDKSKIHTLLTEYRDGHNHDGFSGDRAGDYGVDSTNEVGKERLSATGNYQQATVTTISIFALIALSTMAWFVYAYFFPHTWSGQLLIKYRPSRWQWRRGEPRYTAASIHM